METMTTKLNELINDDESKRILKLLFFIYQRGDSFDASIIQNLMTWPYNYGNVPSLEEIHRVLLCLLPDEWKL